MTLLLHNGDTLTIRQLPGWNDLGASVTVRGEVTHPGNYGIRPGERLSSVLARAGGFLPTAYPKGIVFQREDVRQLEQKSRDELIQRIRQEGATFKTSIQETAQDQAALAQAALAQRNSAIEALQQAPVIGRLVVRMPSDLARFRGSPDDIEAPPRRHRIHSQGAAVRRGNRSGLQLECHHVSSRTATCAGICVRRAAQPTRPTRRRSSSFAQTAPS